MLSHDSTVSADFATAARVKDKLRRDVFDDRRLSPTSYPACGAMGIQNCRNNVCEGTRNVQCQRIARRTTRRLAGIGC
jgi:hypothetical protein